jgi:hypothetical protein
MKKLFITVLTTVFFGFFSLKAQSVNLLNPLTPVSIPTTPANISQLEVNGKLLTQNSKNSPSGVQVTGSFDATARWNSMGNIDYNAVAPNLTQTLNGLRTQTNGRGLAWGHSIPAPGQTNAGKVSNSFIEWIGNNAVSPVVDPGNLEFRYAANSTGASGARYPIFTMVPSPNPTTLAPALCYAEPNTLLGQLRAGSFGSFTASDSWSATGEVGTTNFLTYGNRHQFEGVTLNTAIVKDLFTFNNVNVVMDYGINSPEGISINSFKFRSFSDPNSFSSIKNIWQSKHQFSNMILGRQDANTVNAGQFYFSLFDGVASNASNTALNFIQKAGIYATSDG